MVMLRAFVMWVLGEPFRLPEKHVQRPCGTGTECGMLEGWKDGGVNAERKEGGCV